MVPIAGSEVAYFRDAVALDVTTFIGADEYILARNHGVEPRDPFSRQCYVELVQSILFMRDVYVPHPILTAPTALDFGAKPELLRRLIAAGLVKPLVYPDESVREIVAAESAFLDELRRQGRDSFRAYLSQIDEIDALVSQRIGTRSTRSRSLANRIREWCTFQRSNVRTPTSHSQRIGGDGVEQDGFGEWARSTAGEFSADLTRLAGEGEGLYLVAAVVRGLKYEARTEVGGLSYQSHPLRRDFLVNFTVRSAGADESYALGIAKVVRGVAEDFANKAGTSPSRVQLYELALPFLGGRLWKEDEEGAHDDSSWTARVVDRLLGYRTEMRHLRAAIGRCRTEEDYLRLARDVEGVLRDALARVGIPVGGRANATERDLVDGVASLVSLTSGLPHMKSLWLITRSLLHGMRPPGGKHVRFVYKEILSAWQYSGA